MSPNSRDRDGDGYGQICLIPARIMYFCVYSGIQKKLVQAAKHYIKRHYHKDWTRADSKPLPSSTSLDIS